MTRCIVHFGMPKTGSSSIHSTLLQVPSKGGLRYLHEGGVNFSRALATAFMENPDEFSGNKRRGFTPDVLAKNRSRILDGMERVLQAKYDTVILSAEMVTMLPPEALNAMAKWLKSRSSDIVLAGYVREPYSFMESMFQTSIRNGRGDFNLKIHYPKYRKRFVKLEKAFGLDAVRYFPYAPAKFVNGNVVNDFAARFGLDASGWTLQRKNQSFSRDALSLLYIYRKFGPKAEHGMAAVRAHTQLMRLLESIPGQKTRLTERLVAPVIQEFAEDIEWMEGRLGESLRPERSSRASDEIESEDDLLVMTQSAHDWLRSKTDGRIDIGSMSSPNLPGVAEAVNVIYRSLFNLAKTAKPRPVQKSI